jgi:hypothetical protein
MMGLPAGTRVWLAVGRTDMCEGFDGLDPCQALNAMVGYCS